MRRQRPIRDLPTVLALTAFLLVLLAVAPPLAIGTGAPAQPGMSGQAGDFPDLPLCSGLPAIDRGIADIRRDLDAARDLYSRENLGNRTCRSSDAGSVCDQVTRFLLEAESRATQIVSDAVGTDDQGSCWRCNPDELLYVNLSAGIARSRRACSAGSPSRNAWVLEDIRINPGNHDLQKVTRFGNGEETTHTCFLSDKNLGVSDETRRPDGSSYGYRYQFVFDRPPDRIFPGESYTINVRGSGSRFPEPGRAYVGQLYFSSDTLGIRTFLGTSPTERTPARQPFVIPEPQGDMNGQVVISTPASTSRNELALMASLGNEAACRVEYVYRPEY